MLATPLGTFGALGLARLPRGLKPLVMTVLLSPMFVPVIIVAVAMYLAYAPLGLADTYGGLILAHTTLAVPFVVILINAALQGVNPSVLRAAASLGAPPFTVLMRVLLPLVAPGVVAAAVVSFATSFDEIVVALFLAGTEHKTLPIKMFEGARDEISPAITAASTVLVLTSLLFLGAVEAMRRRRERLEDRTQSTDREHVR
jgi:putative spermidine/putrescine transport system permease protein